MRNPPTPAAVTFTDVQQLPLVLTADLVMGLYHVRNYAALLREKRLGRVPQPFAVKPMRWSKADVVKHLTQPRAAATRHLRRA